MALPGNYGKPRPAVIVQSDRSSDLATIVVCPITSTTRPDLPAFRITIVPSAENSLRELSQVMIDKPSLVPRAKVYDPIGRLSDVEMAKVSAALAALLDLG